MAASANFALRLRGRRGIELQTIKTIMTVLPLTPLLCFPAQAETFFSCGSSVGRSFYPLGPFTTEADAGWIEDGISDGAVALVSEGSEVDVLIKDAVGMMSARSQGANVTLLRVEGDFATVLVEYPLGPIELYTFDGSRGLVYWSQHKFGVMIDKAGTFVAVCN
jgi:hypothetical protein